MVAGPRPCPKGAQWPLVWAGQRGWEWSQDWSLPHPMLIEKSLEKILGPNLAKEAFKVHHPIGVARGYLLTGSLVKRRNPPPKKETKPQAPGVGSLLKIRSWGRKWPAVALGAWLPPDTPPGAGPGAGRAGRSPLVSLPLPHPHPASRVRPFPCICASRLWCPAAAGE